MPALQPKENWVKTGRWDTMDDLYKVKDISEKEYALGPTHEEVVVPLVKQFISSYKDLPFYAYQIQTKFRMELRAKAGILRGREFAMKDLYSFHTSEEDLAEYYEIMKGAYKTIFERAGIGERTYLTFADGGSFSKYSHEFQTVTPAGEDTIFICEKCCVAVNKEIIESQKVCPGCGGGDLKEDKAIEVGNIFELKTKFSDAFDLKYKDEDGKEKPVLMGCYGMGLGRVMGTVVEVLSDEKGIVWPEEIAPFAIHLVELSGGNDNVSKRAEKIYESLNSSGVEVLYDDRQASPGEKLNDADLIGIPVRIVVSSKSIEAGGVEVKKRTEGDARIISEDEIIKAIGSGT